MIILMSQLCLSTSLGHRHSYYNNIFPWGNSFCLYTAILKRNKNTHFFQNLQTHQCGIFFHTILCCCIRWIFFTAVTASHALAKERKKVTVQHGTDALQQYRVDSLALEDVINVGTITVEAIGQPRSATPLTAQLNFNFFPDVNHHTRPYLLQQFPAATWLIFHQYENKISSLQTVLTLNMNVRNLVRGSEHSSKISTREGIVIPCSLFHNFYKLRIKPLKRTLIPYQ